MAPPSSPPLPPPIASSPPRPLSRPNHARHIGPQHGQGHLHLVLQHRPPQFLEMVLDPSEEPRPSSAHAPREQQELRVEKAAEVEAPQPQRRRRLWFVVHARPFKAGARQHAFPRRQASGAHRLYTHTHTQATTPFLHPRRHLPRARPPRPPRQRRLSPSAARGPATTTTRMMMREQRRSLPPFPCPAPAPAPFLRRRAPLGIGQRRWWRRRTPPSNPAARSRRAAHRAPRSIGSVGGATRHEPRRHLETDQVGVMPYRPTNHVPALHEAPAPAKRPPVDQRRRPNAGAQRCGDQ